MKFDMKCQDILFVQKEWMRWRDGRFWSFGAHLALAESLRNLGMRCFVVTEDSLKEGMTVLGRRRFDQIWFNDLVHIKRSNSWYQWLASLAPVRVGWTVESLTYLPEEEAVIPELRTRKADVVNRINQMTHLVACDERDAAEIDGWGGVRAMWSPFSVPEWAIRWERPEPLVQKGFFLGSLYGKRKEWLEHSALSSILVRPKSLEDSSVYPFLYDFLRLLTKVLPARNNEIVNAAYTQQIASVRKRNYHLYLKTLSRASAIVNLPHFVKTFSPRVVDGMAAGQPVISWEIPERPLNNTLFEDGREIMLYKHNDPESLRCQIERVLKDRPLAAKIARQAVKRVSSLHTNEKRVQQVVKWVEGANAPSFN